MPIVHASLNLSPEAIAQAHELRGAMPLDEFLSYCTELGIFDVREQFQAQQRDYLLQTMQTSSTQHHRSQAQREASNVKEMTRKKDE